jgi:hypothetical protein
MKRIISLYKKVKEGVKLNFQERREYELIMYDFKVAVFTMSVMMILFFIIFMIIIKAQ